MIAAPSLLHIIFFIVSLLAPADTVRITLSESPSDARRFTKNANGSWTLGTDDSLWKVDGEFVVMQPAKERAKEERTKVAPFVGDARDAAKSLAAHDWEKEKTLKLSKSLTVEKSDGGFIFHIQKSPDVPVLHLHAILTK